MKLCLYDSGPLSPDGPVHRCATCGQGFSETLYRDFAGTPRWEQFRTERVVHDKFWTVTFTGQPGFPFEWVKT